MIKGNYQKHLKQLRKSGNRVSLETILPDSRYGIRNTKNIYNFFCGSCHFFSLVCQGDRAKAQKTMEATWNTMEKKEKIVWIKKAAEDQKRYEVSSDKSIFDLRSFYYGCCQSVLDSCNTFDSSFTPLPSFFGRGFYFHDLLYEMFCTFLTSTFLFTQRELSEMRSPAQVMIPGKKIKFEGEPKKPPS